MRELRQDIQALRGWAVLLVVLDHADLEPFTSGYLGVDIFFVISGFLITGILARTIRDGTFSFAEFYFRRARRILPAAYVTIVLTTIGSIWFLTSVETVPLASQVWGAVGYFINFVLWQQTDYFAADANLTPLLHMWSLAVEEQFYILLPLLMYFVPSRRWIGMTASLLLTSIGVCALWMSLDPTGAFYMLPSRAWELLIGSIGSLWLVNQAAARRACELLFYPAICLLVVIPCLTFGSHPGFQALIICIATFIVMLANKSSISLLGSVWALANIGNISYSLYLVHWPIMVFLNAATLSVPTLAMRVAAVGFAFAVSIILYASVERPARNAFKTASVRFAVEMLAASAVVISSYYVASTLAKSPIDFAAIRAPNYGLNQLCDYSGRAFVPLAECGTKGNPTVLVWGDSFAMHLVPGLYEYYGDKIGQATFSSCAPIEHLAVVRNKGDVKRWADRCLAFSQDVLQYIRTTPTITTVILASPWRRLVDGQSRFWDDSEGERIATTATREMAVKRLDQTVKTLRELGKQVFLVAPPPSGGGDTSACVERLILGKVLINRSSCDIPALEARNLDENAVDLLDAVAKREGVSVIKLADVLCSKDSCSAVLSGIPVYRDSGHLSIEGSKVVARRLHDAGLLPILR